MKNKSLSPRLASLAAGLLIAGSPAAKGQGYVNTPQVLPSGETINWSGIVNALEGTGNGVANGSAVDGLISFNLANASLILGNGSTSAASEYLVSGNGVVDINGAPTSYPSFEISANDNAVDYYGNRANSISIEWGPYYSDGIVIYDSPSLIMDSSISSVQTLLNAGLTEALPYPGDAGFEVGSDGGFNYAVGNLSTANVIVPEPSTVALGVLGGVGLVAAKLRNGLNRRKTQKAVGLTSGI